MWINGQHLYAAEPGKYFYFYLQVGESTLVGSRTRQRNYAGPCESCFDTNIISEQT